MKKIFVFLLVAFIAQGCAAMNHLSHEELVAQENKKIPGYTAVCRLYGNKDESPELKECVVDRVNMGVQMKKATQTIERIRESRMWNAFSASYDRHRPTTCYFSSLNGRTVSSATCY